MDDPERPLGHFGLERIRDELRVDQATAGEDRRHGIQLALHVGKRPITLHRLADSRCEEPNGLTIDRRRIG